ncbi:MAG: PD40 domain-containing protein [Chloroflexia bacterium]|nr:PD40 domain-containing protein [Chloroflexia bacterium]
MPTTHLWRPCQVLLALLALALAWPAGHMPRPGPLAPAVAASSPGDNGRIAFASNRNTAANTTGDFEIFTMQPDGADLQQLTNNTTDDRWPAWSPDGKKIAYANGADHIVVMDANGSNPTPLTSGSGRDALPTWAPGGGFIAFTRFQGGQTNIFTMQSTGANQTQITTGSWNSEPDWAPDGSRIAFEGRVGSTFALYTMLIDGSDLTRVLPASLTADRDPSWSPDGTKITFYRQVGFQNDIFVVDADGSNEVNLTNAARNEYYPVWSPDGTEIAFVADIAGSSEIVTMRANGSNPQTLAANPGEDEAPSWQPTTRRVPPIVKGPPKFSRGSAIVFVSGRVTPGNPEGDFELFTLTMNPLTGDVVTQLTANTVDDLSPAWSPDGSRIAFERSGDIYVMNADGSGQVNLTNDPRGDHGPRWSPSGARIVFSRDVSPSNTDLFTMNADGSAQGALTNTPTQLEYRPDWSADGVSIAFVSSTAGNTYIGLINVSGSGRQILINFALNEDHPRWSPDGQQIAFSSNGNDNNPSLQTDIWTARADGANPINRTASSRDYEEGPTWSPDGKQIAYAVRTFSDPNYELFTMKANGASRTNRSNNPAMDGGPDWAAKPAAAPAPLASSQHGQGQPSAGGDRGKHDKKQDKKKDKKRKGKKHGARGKHQRSNGKPKQRDRDAARDGRHEPRRHPHKSPRGRTS